MIFFKVKFEFLFYLEALGILWLKKCILQPRDLIILSLQDDSGYFARVRIIKLDLSFLLRYLRSKCTAWMMLAQPFRPEKKEQKSSFSVLSGLSACSRQGHCLEGHNLNLSSNPLQYVEILASLLDLFIAMVFLLQPSVPKYKVSPGWVFTIPSFV